MNYYFLRTKVSTVHIGKKSSKSQFVFHGYDDFDFKMKSYEDWKNFLLTNKIKIYDKCGKKIKISMFLKIIEDSRAFKEKEDLISDYPAWYDEEGFLFHQSEFC